MRFGILFSMLLGLWSLPSYGLTTTCPSSTDEFHWEFSPGDTIRFTWHVETINMYSLYVRTVDNIIEVYLLGGSLGFPQPPQFYDASVSIPTPPIGTYDVQIMPFVPIFGATAPLITCPEPFFLPLVVGPTGTPAVPTPASSALINILLIFAVAIAALHFLRRSKVVQ